MSVLKAGSQPNTLSTRNVRVFRYLSCCDVWVSRRLLSCTPVSMNLMKMFDVCVCVFSLLPLFFFIEHIRLCVHAHTFDVEVNTWYPTSHTSRHPLWHFDSFSSFTTVAIFLHLCLSPWSPRLTLWIFVIPFFGALSLCTCQTLFFLPCLQWLSKNSCVCVCVWVDERRVGESENRLGCVRV